MSILKKHVAHPVALLAAIATLASGLTCMTNPVASPKAHADELKPAYATAKIVKKADGTGHGTSSQTFVNSKNGFATGDDSPTDGVVASGDTVEYSLTLNFNAAGKRTINVKFDLDDAPYLQTADGGGFCQPGQLVTAKKNSDGSCSYTVPAGGVETMTQTFYLKAKDTGGLVKPGQIPKIVVAREGGMSTTYRTDELTVVSAPAADLVIDNGGNPVKGQYSYEHRTYWSQNTDATGDFTIRADALTYPGYSSTKGASTSIDWTTKVDISDFPQGTVWTVGGQRITRNSDKEQYLTVSSGKNGAAATISYRIPAGTDALKNMKEGDVKYYDVHLVPDETVFSVKDDNGDALLNMGKGGEPGWNIGRDKSTYNKDTGARVGYPYANNDWSRAIIQRLKPTPAGKIPLFGKGLQRPNTASKTMFDKENLTFDAAEGKADIYHYYSDGSGDTVSRGTQVKTILEMYAANVTADKLKNTTPTMQDEWDNTRMRWDGSLEVTQNGAPVSDYKIQWADSKDNWHDGEPSDTDAPNVKKIRVTFNPDTLTLGKGAPNVQVMFNTLAIADVSKGNVEALDTLTAWLTEDDKASVTNWVWIAKPVDPTTSIDISLKAYDGEGNQVYANNSSNHPSGSAVDLTPGMRVDYTVTEQLRTILLSNTSMTPTITVPKPKGLYNPTCDDSFWQMKVDGNNLVFTPRSGKVTPEVDRMGSATLPDLHFSGIVSNLATGTVTASANMSVDVDENGALQAQTIKSNTPSVPFPVSNAETNSGIMRVKTTKAEISDPLTWEFNVYGKGGGHTGTMDSMLLLPANGDEKYVQDKLVEYERGYSNYHGSYELTQPVTVNMDNSTSTTVYYSTTTGKKSDNPADYEWKTWDELSAIEKKNITAIRLTSTVVASDDKLSYSAVNGIITLTPSDNVKDDKYTLWLGRNYYSDASDKPAGNQPWPDVAKVVAGSISGTVWWDKDENTLIGDSEEHIEGVEVTLGKQDSNGGWQTVKTVKTDKDGYYEFDLLHSGTYRTSVKRNTGTSTGDGVQTQVKTYYGKLENVTNTRSWSNKIKSNAKDTSDNISLGIGIDQKNVDYGYAKPDPKATVDKTVTGTSCTDTKCVINWDVKVQNKGKSTKKAANVPPVETFTEGVYHSLALDSDGHLWAWGNNGAGQLGDGTNSGGLEPVEIKPDTTFVQVSADVMHSLALDSDGHVWAWGDNGAGQLGDGTTSRRLEPVEIKPDTTFVQVSTNDDHSLALDSDGHLWAWGDNSDGQLGDGTTSRRLEPVEIDSDATFVQVSAGYMHSLALDSDGHVWAWGTNNHGQLGDGTNAKHDTPMEVDSDTTFTQVNAGNMRSLALDSDGHLWAWGTDVGDGTSYNRYEPVEISANATFTQVSANFGHSLALDSDGHVWAWGDNGAGQLGDGTNSGERLEPVEVDSDATFVQVSAGYIHSLALDSNGNLWAWGVNNYGQLGDGSTDNQNVPTLVSVEHTWKSGIQTPTDTSTESSGTSRFDTSSTVSDRMSAEVHDVTATAGTVSIESGGAKQVATSGDHKFVLTSEGLLYAWGNNQYGQLGFKPDTTNSATPTNVNKPTIINGSWLKVAAGGKHSAAISTDGHLYTTGWNGSGQLGTGDTDNRDQWTEVASDKTFIDVACGNQFTVAIASDGTLWGAGNAVGSQNYATWTQIGSDVKFTQLSASMEGFIALNTSGGYLYSGTGVSLGQLSSGGYTQVAAAFGQMYALKDDGTVFWFSTTYSATLSGLKDIVKISGGYNTLYAIDKNQHLWASGWNGDGQLANGKTGNGMYWTNGSTGNNTNVIGTPVDTGIIASDVAGGDRDVLILGKQVMIAGFDPYGDGKTGGARSIGLKGMAVSSDPTAVPVEPSSETTENGLTTRTYNLPYSIEPGGYVIYHFTGTVDRETADMTGKDQSYIDEWVKKNTKTILNQAWFDSEHTPYSGTPHASGKTKPNTPDATKLDTNTNDVTGNPTCRTDTDYTEEGRQHWFSTSDEDSCDQVGTIITPTTTAKKLGSISGLYWEDANKNGIQDEGENTHFAGQTVILTDENGKQLATTKTDKDGKYIFERLDANGNKYRIQFTKVNHRDFTTPDAGDKTPATDGSSTDSDAYTDEANKLTITLTQDAPTKKHVDAGVLPETWLATMPHTGMGLLLPLLMLVSVSGLVAAIILLRKKEQ